MIESIIMELNNNNDPTNDSSMSSPSAAMNPFTRLTDSGTTTAPSLAPTLHDGRVNNQVDASSILFLLGIIIFVLIFSCLKHWFLDRRIAARQGRRTREARKRLIRERIVFKTVIKKKASSSQEDESKTPSTKVDDGDKESNTDEERQENLGGGEMRRYMRQKSNLEISSTSQHNAAGGGGGGGGGDSTWRLECQICLTDFQVGDKICWSNNPECVHTFHIACLEPWLMKHDECPLCRAPYLVEPKEVPAPKTGTPNIRGTSPITRRVVTALNRLCLFRRTSEPLQQDRRNHNEQAEEEIDAIPEISLQNNTENSDDYLSSPNMIPLEEMSDDCSSSDEDGTWPTRNHPTSDVESGVAAVVQEG